MVVLISAVILYAAAPGWPGWCPGAHDARSTGRPVPLAGARRRRSWCSEPQRRIRAPSNSPHPAATPTASRSRPPSPSATSRASWWTSLRVGSAVRVPSGHLAGLRRGGGGPPRRRSGRAADGAHRLGARQRPPTSSRCRIQCGDWAAYRSLVALALPHPGRGGRRAPGRGPGGGRPSGSAPRGVRPPCTGSTDDRPGGRAGVAAARPVPHPVGRRSGSGTCWPVSPPAGRLLPAARRAVAQCCLRDDRLLGGGRRRSSARGSIGRVGDSPGS